MRIDIRKVDLFQGAQMPQVLLVEDDVDLATTIVDRCFPGRQEVEVRFTPLGTGARILPLP